MTNYTINLNDALRAFKFVAVAQSREKTRYYLNGVFMNKRKGEKLRLIATDGYRMHSIFIGEADEQEFSKLVNSKDIKTIIKELNTHKKDYAHLTILENGYRINELPIVEIVEIDGRFPDYERHIPTIYDMNKIELGYYNATYLSESFKAFATLYKGYWLACTIQANDIYSGAIIKAQDCVSNNFNALAVVMPMNVR